MGTLKHIEWENKRKPKKMILRLNLISRRWRGSITNKFFYEHRSGTLHKYVNDRNREVRGPVWSNFVSWPDAHVKWWRQMEHSRRYEEATELNMDEYKKARGHKKRMKEVQKMGNQLHGGLGLKMGVLSAEMLTTDTSNRQVLVIRMDKYCPTNVKRLKWVFKKYRPYVYQTLIGPPNTANCCECFVIFRDMRAVYDYTHNYKWKDHPDAKAMGVRHSYLWRHGGKNLWPELDTLIKARWENRAIFLIDQNITEAQAQTLSGGGLSMTYLSPNMVQFTRPTNQTDIEVDENDRTAPIKSLEGYDYVDSANLNRWYFELSNQIDPTGMIDGCLDNFFLTSYLPHPITGHPGLDIDPGEVKSIILPGTEFDESSGKKLCSLIFVFRSKALYDRIRTPMEEGEGPVRDAIYHHLELYNGINETEPIAPEDPKTTEYFMKWMARFNENVDTARRPDGSIDYAASSTKRHQRGTAQLADVEVFNKSVEYWWRQHLKWNIKEHYRPGCAKFACYQLAKFMFESLPVTAYITIAPRADEEASPVNWSDHDPRSHEYAARKVNANIYAKHAEALWPLLLTNSFKNRDNVRFLAADEIEIDFENGRDFREADVLINEGSLANVVRRSAKLTSWDRDVVKACADHLEHYELLMIDRHLLLRDEQFAAEYKAKQTTIEATQEQEAAIDEAMSEWSSFTEAEVGEYRTKDFGDVLRRQGGKKKKKKN